MPTLFAGSDAHVEELRRRPSRPPDFERESRALVRLARSQTGSRETLLQTIVESARDLCCAGSAGISLLEEHDGQRYFRWLSVAGEVSVLRGKITAWRDCLCGMALDAHESLLFTDAQQEFGVLWAGPVRVTEGLVVPIGTLVRIMGSATDSSPIFLTS